jgi:hypothetical protein
MKFFLVIIFAALCTLGTKAQLHLPIDSTTAKVTFTQTFAYDSADRPQYWQKANNWASGKFGSGYKLIHAGEPARQKIFFTDSFTQVIGNGPTTEQKVVTFRGSIVFKKRLCILQVTDLFCNYTGHRIPFEQLIAWSSPSSTTPSTEPWTQFLHNSATQINSILSSFNDYMSGKLSIH